MIVACVWGALPLAIALFPQEASLPVCVCVCVCVLVGVCVYLRACKRVCDVALGTHDHERLFTLHVRAHTTANTQRVKVEKVEAEFQKLTTDSGDAVRQVWFNKGV